MEVSGNRIIKIEESDIVNGTFELPEGVTVVGVGACMNSKTLKKIPHGVIEIEEYAFAFCTSLTELPNSITTVENNAFEGCTSLKKLPNSIVKVGYGSFSGCTSLKKLPDSIMTVGEYAFAFCTSLTELPNSITTVKNNAFAGCSLLKKIPNSVTEIGIFAFEECTSLEEIPDSITTIAASAFEGCTSLATVHFKEIDKIHGSAFTNTNIQKIVTPYGEMEVEESTSRCIIMSYLYLYANSLVKEKYRDLNEFIDNKYISSIRYGNSIFGEKSVQKFKNLYFKMRKLFDINENLFSYMSLGMTEEFELKTWNKVKDLFPWQHSFEMSKAFAEMMEVFGLFKKDANRKSRIENFKNFIVEKPYILTEEQYRNFLYAIPIVEDMYRSLVVEDDEYEVYSSEYQDKVINLFREEVACIYVLKQELEIPEEFQIYIKEVMSEEDIYFIKKLNGHYGKRINDFVKENYELAETKLYHLKEEGYQDESFMKHLFNTDLGGHVNYHSLHRIFDGCTKEFNSDFYEFFMENIHIILQDEKLQSYVNEIQVRFTAIQAHYASTSGVKKINLKQAMDYITNSKFDYHPGNKEIAGEITKAGVVSKEAFEYYQTAYEKNQRRKKSSLIKRKNIYTIDGFVIQAELLRKDEIEASLVGEVNNTNCCQVYGGVGHNCMAHAVYSDDGGVFTTKLLQDGKEILLTQSWDWQNNNVYCHDNIEGTSYLKGNERLQDAVLKVFQLDGEEIIKKSQEEIEAYIKTRKKTIEKSIINEEEKQRELQSLRELEERQVIRVVTSGAGNNDIVLSKYVKSSIQVNDNMLLNGHTFTLTNFQPVEYNNKQVYFDRNHSAYSDSDDKQYILAGSLEKLCLGKQEPLVPIYRDERRVILEQNNIRDYTFHKVQTIEKKAYPEEILQLQDMTRNDFIEGYPNVYLGEDWYMIYEERDEQTVYISELAKINPELEDEGKEQLDEMNQAISSLLEQYEVVEADLKEDTSYLLYLMNKKRGIVEQIGEDESYKFDKDSERTVVSLEEQEEFLKNIKDIRTSKNPEQIMHHVTFKKGKRWAKSVEEKGPSKR